jgi:hypothetical protein
MPYHTSWIKTFNLEQVHKINLLIRETQKNNCNIRYQSHKNQRSTTKGLQVDGHNHEGTSCGTRILIE